MVCPSPEVGSCLLGWASIPKETNMGILWTIVVVVVIAAVVLWLVRRA